MKERSPFPSLELQEAFLREVNSRQLNRDISSRRHTFPNYYPEFGLVDEKRLFYSVAEQSEDESGMPGSDFVLRRYNACEPNSKYPIAPLSDLEIYEPDREHDTWIKIRHYPESGRATSYSQNDRTELSFSKKDFIRLTEHRGVVSKDFHHRLHIVYNNEGELRTVLLNLRDDRRDSERENPVGNRENYLVEKRFVHSAEGVSILDGRNRFFAHEEGPLLPTELPQLIESGRIDIHAEDDFSSHTLSVPLFIMRPDQIRERLVDPRILEDPFFASLELDDSWRKTSPKSLLGIKYQHTAKPTQPSVEQIFPLE